MFNTFYNLSSSFGEGQRGLTYKREMLSSTKLEECSICFRFRMDFFTLLGDFIQILEVLDGKMQEKTIDFRISDPLRNIHLFRVTTFVDKTVEMREAGNRDWHWPSFR